jgi:hypothetical protein
MGEMHLRGVVWRRGLNGSETLPEPAGEDARATGRSNLSSVVGLGRVLPLAAPGDGRTPQEVANDSGALAVQVCGVDLRGGEN